MRRSYIIRLFAVGCFIVSLKGNGQITIAGPTCVLSGTEYQYNIVGNIPAGSQLCVTGGTITGNATSCTTALTSGYVRIVWAGNNCSISFSSSGGNSSKAIAITFPLQPGSITTQKKEQYISYNSSPSTISCSGPSGGGCGASYSFQWQRSLDNLNWENINSATSQNLNGISALTQTYFYRRKTTNNISGSIAYSDAAAVYVAPSTNGN